MDDLLIKRLYSVEDMKEMGKLEALVWGEPAVPHHQTVTVAKNGGIILGAYDNQKLIGLLYSFPGFKDGEVYLCSHSMGMHPEYRKMGIGRKLKDTQKEIALKEGYRKITWTFDPLESVNANLNIGKLKAICNTYIENCYGNMEDSLNKGLASDRFLVEWHLEMDGKSHPKNAESIADITYTEQLFPRIERYNVANLESRYLSVPIPTNYQQIKRADHPLAVEWRKQTRDIFKTLFGNGYTVVGIDHQVDQPIQYYILEKESL